MTLPLSPALPCMASLCSPLVSCTAAPTTALMTWCQGRRPGLVCSSGQIDRIGLACHQFGMHCDVTGLCLIPNYNNLKALGVKTHFGKIEIKKKRVLVYKEYGTWGTIKMLVNMSLSLKNKKKHLKE